MARHKKRRRQVSTAHAKRCPTGKFRYRDRLGAEIALSGIDHERDTRGRTNRGECRYYHCPKCKGYHLTSQEKRVGQ